jgi:hypothetical protein
MKISPPIAGVPLSPQHSSFARGSPVRITAAIRGAGLMPRR